MGYFRDKKENGYYGLGGSGVSSDDIDQSKAIVDRWNKEEEEERKRREEQARAEAEANKPFSQKFKETIGGSFSDADTAKTSFKIMGRTIINSFDEFGNDIVDLLIRKPSNLLFGEGWGAEDTMRDEAEDRISSDAEKTASMATKQEQKDLITGTKFAGDTAAFFLLPEAGGLLGAAGKMKKLKGISRIAGATADKMAARTAGGFATRMGVRGAENTAIGAVFDYEDDKTVSEISTNARNNFLAGAVFSGALDTIGMGISKWKNAPIEKIRKNVNDEYGKRLISGINDAKIATELLDHGSKSPKVIGSVKESLDFIGIDTTKSRATDVTIEGQRAIAGETVATRVSQRARRAIYNEIKESGLFAIEKTDPVDTVIERGVDSILANGDTTGKLSVTKRFTEAILGVINPEIDNIAEIVSQKATTATAQVAKAVETSPEAATMPPDEVSVKTQAKTPDKPQIDNENLLQIKEALDSGDKDAAKALYDALAADYTLPKFEDIDRYALANKTKEGIDRFRANLYETSVAMQMDRTRLADERALYDSYLGKGTIDDIQKVLRSKAYRSGKMDVSDIDGFDEVADIVRSIKNDPEMSANEALDVIESLPTRSESKMGVPKVGGTDNTPGFIEVKAEVIKPVKTRGKVRESSAYKKTRKLLQERYTDEFEALGKESQKKVEYRQANLDEQAEKAVKILQDNPDRADRIAQNLEPYPDDVLQESVTLAVAQDALDKGDIDKYRRLQESLSLRATRRGQENVALRGRVDINSPDHFIHEVLRERASKIDSDILPKGGRDKTKSMKVKEVIDDKVKKLADDVKMSKVKIDEAQKLIDQLTCK